VQQLDLAEAAGHGLGQRRGRPRAGSLPRPLVISALLAFVTFGLPPLLSPYWTGVLTAVAVYAVVAAGLGLLVGRVGMVSLGQIAVLALGAWIATRLDFATRLPFPLVLLIAGLITGVLGVLVGLPALRLSGLYLALITLMFAGAINVVLATTNFPNGGKGFLGYTDSPFAGGVAIRRPSIAHSDSAFYHYSMIVCALMFLLALWHVRSRPGRAWAAIRQSESAALSLGINVTLYKLWAFGLAAFMTGVAGGLLAGASGVLYTYQFTTLDSIVLLAVVLMGGVYSLWGAILAALLMQLLPTVLDIWNLPPDLLTILFGVGVLQVLLTAPAGLVDQVPTDLARLGRLLLALRRRSLGTRSAA
jgi:branched-chain amino acid transport system permease protein